MTKQDALSKLRDIHLPDPIGIWPLAPGWYILGILLFLSCFYGAFILHRYYRNTRARKKALFLLDSYQCEFSKNNNPQRACSQIAELLKRVALVYFPRKEVAHLQGEKWLIFLEDTSKNINFIALREELTIIPFRKKVDSCDLAPLFMAARQWIKQRRGRCLN